MVANQATDGTEADTLAGSTRAAPANIVELRKHDQNKPAQPGSKSFDGPKPLPLHEILVMEAAIRKVDPLQELRFFAANELKSLIKSQQVLVHKPKGKQDRISVISAIAVVDPWSPLLQWLEGEFSAHRKNRVKQPGPKSAARAGPEQFRLRADSAPGGSYVFSYVLHLPITARSGRKLGAISFLSDKPFIPADVAIAVRLVETLSHAWSGFVRPGISPSRIFTRPVMTCLSALLVLAMFIPVPLTVLAPFSVIAHEPEIVAAPMNGAIGKVHIASNQHVEVGTLLFTYNTTELQNALDIANRQITIADARYRRAAQDAFGTGEGRRELAIDKSEYQLALAEQAAAERRIAQAEIRAHRAGTAILSDAHEWSGRPVQTGERIMRIADESRVRFKIELGTGDAIILRENATARLFMDSDPLRPINAVITSTAYEGEMSPSNTLIFPLEAKLADNEEAAPRIGLRGTAQLHGNNVQLWFFLFRKPLSYLRQLTGW